MNRSNGAVADLDRATDQLVDEICQRLDALYSLVNTTLTESGPPIDHIRRHAADVVRRVAHPHSHAEAIEVARTLWPQRSSAHVPVSWWTTPLGTLISPDLDGVVTTSARRPHGTLRLDGHSSTVGDAIVARSPDSPSRVPPHVSGSGWRAKRS